MNELVSVIIPTLPERKEYLKRALDSVKKQTYKNIETLVITEGKNACEARNIGIKKAKGEYIAFLDDDDEWLPTKIEKQIEAFSTHGSVNLVACFIEDRRFEEKYIDTFMYAPAKEHVLRALHFLSTSSYMVRRRVFESIGYFDETLPSAQEYDFALRISEKSFLCCIQEVLVIQHKSENQITKDNTKKIKGLQMIYKKHCKHSSLSIKIKFKVAILLYKMQPYLGKSIEKLVVRYKKR